MPTVVLKPCWNLSLICSFSHTHPSLDVYIIHGQSKWAPKMERKIRTRSQWRLPEGWGLINNLHIFKQHWIKSNMACFFVVSKKNKKRTDSRFNWETSHVQSEGFASLLLEIPCHFFSLFHQRISSLLSNPPTTVFHCHCSLWEDCTQLSLTLLQYTSACMHCMPPSSPPRAGRKIKMPCCR